MPLPVVIVLDVDGTIIGDITPQIMVYDIQNEVKTAGGSLSYKSKDLPLKLKSGIIRPYFSKCVQKLKEKIPQIEFFIYTASEKQWAHNIIKQIETAAGFKFNKPYFTRNNCITTDNDITKALKNIKPCIYKTLKKRYGLKSITDLNDRIIVVDNRNDVYANTYDAQYHIKCSTYDFKYPENIPALVTTEEYKRYWNTIGNVVEKYYGIRPTPDYLLFQEQFYNIHTKVLASSRKTNNEFLKDVFYNKLYKLIMHVLETKQYDKFNPAIVRFINKQLTI